MVRIASDVGGTFTDSIAYDPVSNRIAVSKVSTTPAAREVGTIEGLRRTLQELGSTGGAVAYVGHGMTTATNAVIQRNGAKTAFVTNRGFADLLAMLRAVGEGTMRTTAMIMLIIVAAQFLNFVLAAIGVTDGIGKAIEALGLGKIGTMILIVIFYVILGCFMETISMMILTTPFIFPIVVKLGWDPIWWGVVLTVLIEVALITPPVGLNLYVVQGMRGRGSIKEVIRGSFPFIVAMLALIALLMAAPDIALWLPRYFMG